MGYAPARLETRHGARNSGKSIAMPRLLPPIRQLIEKVDGLEAAPRMPPKDAIRTSYRLKVGVLPFDPLPAERLLKGSRPTSNLVDLPAGRRRVASATAFDIGELIPEHACLARKSSKPVLRHIRTRTCEDQNFVGFNRPWRVLATTIPHLTQRSIRRSPRAAVSRWRARLSLLRARPFERQPRPESSWPRRGRA